MTFQTYLLLSAVAALIVALVKAHRRGWVPSVREREKVGELTIDLKCDAGPVVAELKPVNAELERMAGLLDRIGESLPKTVAAAKRAERPRAPQAQPVRAANAKPRKR